MHLLFLALLNFSFSTISAQALDTTELSAERVKFFHSASFYCETGRAPMRNSSEAWAVQPNQDCRFSGPLDTKINRLKLEAPVLNPTLSLAGLKQALVSWSLSVEDRGNSLSFRLPSGQKFDASYVDYKKMTDPLFHYGGYPEQWGKSFLSMSAGAPSDLQAFIEFASSKPGSALFWQNPHFEDEQKALPKLLGNRKHSPLEIISHCNDDWKNFHGTRAMLFVGDLHTPATTQIFHSLVKERTFAWAALEFTRDMDPALQSFLAATDAAQEDSALSEMMQIIPDNTVSEWKALLRTLKASHVKIILIDYKHPYFNFPYTNTGFHGMIMATRNLLWVNRLPETWEGTGVLFAGLDHVAATPSADFQNFAWERYPGLQLAFVNPLEVCSR